MQLLFISGFVRVLLTMQLGLLTQKLLHGFPVHFIGNTTIDRTYRRALRLFVKALALGTFIGSNVISIYCNGIMWCTGTGNTSIHKRKIAFYRSTVCYLPFHSTFINSRIGTFGFAGAAIDTFVSYFYSHLISNLKISNILQPQSLCISVYYQLKLFIRRQNYNFAVRK
jgi:hypothetical protein